VEGYSSVCCWSPAEWSGRGDDPGITASLGVRSGSTSAGSISISSGGELEAESGGPQ